MDSDAAQPEPGEPTADIDRLPEIVELVVHEQHFDPPRRVTRAGVDSEVSLAIGITIRLTEPFTTRALGPVLWVGDEPLAIADAERPDQYRFYCFEPDRLREDAPIYLSWGTSPVRRTSTTFTYRPSDP